VNAIRSAVRIALSLLAATMPLSRASPQAPPAPTQNDIVVVGQRLKDALRHFVNSATQTGPTDQIAHWNREICPQVIGIDPAQAEFMRRRIAEIAKTVDLRTGRSSCATMLTIVFTPDAAALADAVTRDFPSDNWKVRALLRGFADSSRPVRWISLSDECGGGCGLPNSRLAKATSPTLQAMLIIVDAKKIGGLSIGEMSDYVGLVALSNPPLTGEPPANSILSLLNAPTANGLIYQLTDYDYSFLAGLYGIRLNLDAASQRASIAARMNQELRRKQPADRPQAPPRN
jgi:hypothetical protein